MRRTIALAIVGAVLLALIAAQLILPNIAEQRIRDRLSRSGKVLAVHVEAFPAIELLWHHADRVVIRLASYRSTEQHLGTTLASANDVDQLDASAAELDTGLLRLHDAQLHKRGRELTGSARVTEADLRAAVPFLDSVQPVASAGGQLTLRGTATVLGITATVDATVQTQNGDVIVTPDVPFGGLATVTVFSNPHLDVQSVATSSAPNGFQVSASGRLR